jgi:hypothetical protein
MARIRSIKPEFWTDEKVVTLSAFARLVFIGLWNFVDDYGRAPCSPARLKMQILPADSADFPQLLAEISGAGLVTIYTIDDKQFLQVNGFEKHQKIDKRVTSKYPAPPISPEPRPFLPLDQGREGIKEGINADASAPPQSSPPATTAEVDYYRRIKEICGQSAGGLAKRLLAAKDGSIPLARAAAEQASTKENPREYLGAIIRTREEPECRPDRSF